MSLVRSRWQAIFPDDNRDIAVIVFEKTLLTPAGADILARAPDLSDAALQQVMACMARHPDAASQVESMRRLPTP